MSIRLMAIDLYKLIRDVEKLENRIENTHYEKRGKMEDQLRKLKAERNRMREAVDGQKDAPPARSGW